MINWTNIGDNNTALPNLFYQNAYIKSIYMRTAPGAPGYPANPGGGGTEARGGEWGIYPGVLFMFGDMEGKVSPYPIIGADTSPPAPPVNLRMMP